MWPEIETARTNKRRELVISGKSVEISKRMKLNGLDNSIFNLIDLNYLSLTDTNLNKVPPDISQLVNLQTLILHSNEIKECSKELFELTKLKILDLSRNELEIIPDCIIKLTQIVSLNLSNNHLGKFPLLLDNSKLTLLDLSNNKLTEFPNICSSELICLSELKLHGNEIVEIPTKISSLPALKLLDVSDNKIKLLPGELADCHKLKEVFLKENPITDRRLKKLIDQCRTKQIIDYVKLNCPKSETVDTKLPKKAIQTVQETIPISFKYTIRIEPLSDNSLAINIDNSVKTVRPYIAGCIINKIHFNDGTFKQFIQMQNKLHDGICEKRNAATIATHDLKKLNTKLLKYTALPPNILEIIPLNRTVQMTGAEYFTKLQIEANNLRKEKKRNTYSGIHKYLYLVEGKLNYPCLINSNDETVISLPPLTNSDISKIDTSTTDIFVEVTSAASISICQNVLTQLIKATVTLLEQDLITITPVKVFDNENKVKIVFPSKNDLNFNNDGLIQVVRE